MLPAAAEPAVSRGRNRMCGGVEVIGEHILEDLVPVKPEHPVVDPQDE